jgi:hypothetical protein
MIIISDVLKCYHYLHPMAKCEVGWTNQTKDVKFNLHIFR